MGAGDEKVIRDCTGSVFAMVTSVWDPGKTWNWLESGDMSLIEQPEPRSSVKSTGLRGVATGALGDATRWTAAACW